MKLSKIQIIFSFLTIFLSSSLFGLSSSYGQLLEVVKDERPSCMEEATPAQTSNAVYMGLQVYAILQTLSEDYKKRGQDLKVALIGRRGTALGSSALLRDKDTNDKPLTIEDVHKATRDEYEAQEEDSPHFRNVSKITKDMFKDDNNTLKFSHMGPLLKNHVTKNTGGLPWTSTHKLKPCDKDVSHIFEEGTAKFFLDTPFVDLKETDTNNEGKVLMAVLVIPKMKYQSLLENLFIGDLSIEPSYRNIPYNLAALPFQSSEVNSNQYVLEALGAMQAKKSEVAKWSTSEFRSKAQGVLKKTGYRPSMLSLGTLHSLAGWANVFGMVQYANPNKQKYSSEGLVEIVTIRSIMAYMFQQDLIDKVIKVYMPANRIFADSDQHVNASEIQQVIE